MQAYIHLPNAIYNFDLAPIELMTYAALCSIKDAKGNAVASYKAIAARCSCSTATSQRAIKALEEKGLIQMHRRRYYDGKNRANGYTVAALCSSGFFRVPRSIFQYSLAPSSFAIFACICRCADKAGKAYPSLTKIAFYTRLTVKTIIAHIAALVEQKLLNKCNYIKLDGGFGCNQYGIADMCEHTKHVTVLVAVKKAVMAVSCWCSNRLDMLHQYAYLKGISIVERIPADKGRAPIVRQAYSFATP